MDARISKNYKEHAVLLSELTVSKMISLDYPPDSISAFHTSYFELLQNAFEHGCRTMRDDVRIIIETTGVYISLSVINPKGRKFNIQENLDKNQNFLKKAFFTTRGRGLQIVDNLADTIESIQSNTGIKVTFYLLIFEK